MFVPTVGEPSSLALRASRFGFGDLCGGCLPALVLLLDAPLAYI